MKKKAQFNFVWFFAIIAGAAILILAIYGAVRSADTIKYQSQTEATKSFEILTDPLKAGLSEASVGKIIFNKETKINNKCRPDQFGSNRVSTETITKKDSKPGVEISIKDKYIFSENTASEEFHVFSKPFYYPFKIDDLLFVISEDYCLKNAPEFIENELRSLNLGPMATENCSEDSINVCFNTAGSDCDMRVMGTCQSGCNSKYEEGYVEKDSEKLYFVGSLIYGAIISEKELYDCNVNRILYRTSILSEVLERKAQIQNSNGCNTRLQPYLFQFSQLNKNASSEEIITINQAAKNLNQNEKGELCGLW